LEINTSPLRREGNECSPDNNIYQKYIKAGGRKVTTGSDSHLYSEIAVDFEYAYNLIKQNEKGKVGYFKEHKFIQISDGNKIN